MQSILEFLDAFPGPLFDELSRASPEGGFLRPFLLCVLSPDPSVRQLAAQVAKRVFANAGKLHRMPEGAIGSGMEELRTLLWKQRQVYPAMSLRPGVKAMTLTAPQAPTCCSTSAAASV